MEKFYRLLDLLTRHHRAVGMSILSLLTAGGETIFSNIVFQCPCNSTWNLPYSLSFFICPALVLFLLAYVLSSKVGRLITGCCARDQGDTSGSISHKADPGQCSRMSKCCQKLICSRITLDAALAPVTWIAVALLGGIYYECAASATEWASKNFCQGQMPHCSEKLMQMPCQKKSPENSEEIQRTLKLLRAKSQMYGWILITVVVIFIMLVNCCKFCTSQVSFLQHKFLKIYEKQENEILTAESKRYATELAERNVKCFFEDVYQESVRIPGAAEWKEISVVIEPTDTAYSALHDYATHRPRENAYQNPDSN
ncbi:calcium homeostasis modulator protein 6-like [Petaurus breviceps papuanus]|uniref:calcium homeostasis modulator protein 6-like n=1 Tax=Petaurus breviceps papuanus TaxID=3040969 RepID=UPI0036DE6F72